MPRTKRAMNKKAKFKRTKEEWEEMKRQNPELEQSKSYQLAPKTNQAFEKFYGGIGIVPDDEWDTFLETMRQPLPTTFRITGSRSQAQELLKIINGQYFSKFISRDDGTPKLEPKSLPWYPDELAWQLDFTKKQIKNDNTLKNLHGFMISETESGNISRQEAVSMLPPLLMEIESHHKILDMCAAPGSKTAQLIEMLHSDENVPVPEGYVVANDMDNKRCYLMTHQVKRIQSPNCMIINHDARILPNMFTSKDEDAERVKYDRILCDVPCSGDGTMRKNPDIWNKWHVNGAYNLHRIQKKVLQRGLELLAVGGRLVYSTCSLNPVEDEAVILALIKQCKGAVELVDVSHKFTGLKFCKGTYSWKIMSKKLEWYETVEQAPEHFKNAWDSTMYPPIITEAQEAKLERCIRILPHHQNTGAFFIAVLEKTKELPWSTLKSQGKFDTVIKTTSLDQSEKKIVDSKHFTFGFRGKSGLYTYAKCNLCNVTLQGRNDYNGHSVGRKHRQALEILEADKVIAKAEAEQNEMKTETGSSQQKTVQSEQKTETGSSEQKTETDQNEKKTETESEVENKVNSNVSMETENTVSEKSENTESVTEVKDKGTENCNSDEAKDVDSVDNIDSQSEVTGHNDKVIGDKTEVDGVNAKKRGNSDDGQAGDSENNAEEGPPPVKKMRKDEEDEIKVMFSGHREDPFFFCAKDDPVWPDIKKFYDVSDDLGVEQIMYRNMKRVLYYVSKPIRNLVISNSNRVKFINLGVKCFSNAPSPLVPDCDYRLSQDGLLAIQKHLHGRRIMLTKQDVITVLSQENPFICKLDPEAQATVYAMDPGSVLFHFKPSERDPEPSVEIVFCGWRGKTSVRSFVGKDERSHYLRLCGVELSDIKSQVKEMKAVRDVPTSGTETPMGVPSGDEAELEQWNKGEEAPRGAEADDIEEDNSEAIVNNENGSENMEIQQGDVEAPGTSEDNAK